MKITNKHGLPDAILKAVQNDSYRKGDSDYSISELIKPPRKLQLTKKHWDEIEEDVSDLIWSLFGQAVHHIAERANVSGIVERRLFYEVHGKKISGQMDYYDPSTGILTDYKTATVSKFSFNDFKEWEQQQNCYAQLLRWNGDKVTKLQILGLVRDHRPKEAETAKSFNKPYPGKAEMITLPLWDDKTAVDFIALRVRIHEAAKLALPECTPEERWARPNSYAIKKKNQKNAVAGHSNYVNLETAEDMVDVLGRTLHYVEHRPGKNIRCSGYCSAAPFCDQFKELSRPPNVILGNPST